MINELVIIALLVFIGWQDWQRKKERQEFFDYIKAKDIKELKDIREVAKPVKSEPVLPDTIPLDQLSDDEFSMAIKKDLGREPFIEKIKDKVRRKHG